MNLSSIFSIFLSLALVGCFGGENTSNSVQIAAQAAQKEAQSKTYNVQLTGDWIKDAKVVDSNNQQAVYKGKGVYSFRNQPKGTITLTGGTFEKTGVANKMALRADASSKTLSPLNSFLHDKPHLKGKVLNALNNQDGSVNEAAQARASKVVYLMASNNLLNQFSNSLNNVKSYSDIVASARSSSSNSTNANAINLSLLMISLSFFDVANAEHISKIGVTPDVVSITPNTKEINLYANRNLKFKITFSKAVKNVDTTNIVLVKAGSTENLIANVTKTSGTANTYTATLKRTLDYGASYKLIVKSGITDNAGLALVAFTKTYDTLDPNRRYITQNGAGSKNGTSWTNAYSGAQLQTAIDGIAGVQGTVWVAKGVYRPVAVDVGQTVSAAQQKISFKLKNGVKLYGGFKGDETNLEQRNITTNKTVLSGDIDNNDKNKVDGITTSYRHIYPYGRQSKNSHTVIKLINANVSAANSSTLMDGFYITGGKSLDDQSPKSAGGLTLTNASLTLKNMRFIGNFNGVGANGGPKVTGGAIRAENSTLTINSSKFINNKTQYGGAIASYNSTLSINGSSFNNNEAYFGGAISSVQNTKFEIKNTSFKNNQAEQGGGALYNVQKSYTVTNAAFIGNRAVNEGGAIYNEASSYTITNASFNGNSTQATVGNRESKGGAIYNLRVANSTITNATFAYNINYGIATSKGGAIYNISSAPKLINTTFYNNHANKGGAMFTEGSANTKPMFVNSILWDNEESSDTNKQQYGPLTGSQNNIAYASGDSHIKTNSSTTADHPRLIEKTKSIEGVEHIYFELGNSAIQQGLGTGNKSVAGKTLSIPSKDQIGNSRPRANKTECGNSVCKGAIQVVTPIASAPASKPFIKTFATSTPPNSSEKIITIVFNEIMDTNTISKPHITIKSGSQDIDFSTPNCQTISSSSTQCRIIPTTSLQTNQWYSVTITTGVKNESGIKLNREYIYEFRE